MRFSDSAIHPQRVPKHACMHALGDSTWPAHLLCSFLHFVHAVHSMWVLDHAAHSPPWAVSVGDVCGAVGVAIGSAYASCHSAATVAALVLALPDHQSLLYQLLKYSSRDQAATFGVRDEVSRYGWLSGGYWCLCVAVAE